MEINYLGHASFKLRGKQGTVITDPFDPDKVGLRWNKIKADIVTVSHQHFDHNYLKGVIPSSSRKNKGIFTITGPGEYEVSNILIQGWSTYHDDQNGEQRGKNIMFLIEIDRIRILHCGDLGHELSENMVEEIGQIDIMLVPVGGHYTINAQKAVKIIKNVNPSIVIPMHYQVEGLKPELAEKLSPIADFAKEMGLDQIDPQEKLNISATTIPEDTTTVILKP